MAKLHAPKDGDYKKHIWEGHTLCGKTGWIAPNDAERITCLQCGRKLEIPEDFIELLPKIG